ncbi:MAG: hypothetical protein R3191_02620 [Anaerolineales bacterium]|nr:hypothetical protein [Anaerolineales bacterium]
MTMISAGCASTPPSTRSAATATPFEPDSVDQLLAALQRAAGEVRLGEPTDSALLDADGQTLTVGGERVDVYPYPSSRARQDAQQRLLESPSLEPGVHVWGAGSLLVMYRGGEGGTVLLLSGLLGDSSTIERGEVGPYPPAVTAAIRAVAQRQDVPPGQVQVLGFEQATWSDTCLGLPREGESCEDRTVEGWRVRLEVGGQSFTVRTDAVGVETRVR